MSSKKTNKPKKNEQALKIAKSLHLPKNLDRGAFKASLSPERFSRYLEWAGDNEEYALKLYALNMRVAEAFYPALQTLEITLRNSIHATLSEAFNNEYWFDQKGLLKRMQIAQLKKTKKNIGSSPSSGEIVANLSLGFWTALLHKQYIDLWRKYLNRIAKGKGVTKKQIEGPLESIRRLRNRIAHHEPILHMELPELHKDIITVTGYLEPEAAKWIKHYSRFPRIWSQGGCLSLWRTLIISHFKRF